MKRLKLFEKKIKDREGRQRSMNVQLEYLKKKRHNSKY